MGPDGRGGEQPRGTLVSRNLVREIGIWQKQSSFYFQAVAAQTTLRGNVHFNGPRAGINLNDGFGGGDVLEGNLIANCVRESGDHGPSIVGTACRTSRRSPPASRRCARLPRCAATS